MHRVSGISAFLAAAGLLLLTQGTAAAQPADEPEEAAEASEEGAEEGADAAAEEEVAADEGAAEDDDEAEAEAEDEDEDEDEDYDDEDLDEDLDDEMYGDADEEGMDVAAAEQITTSEAEGAKRPAAQIGLELGSYFRDDDEGSTLEFAPLLSAWVGVGSGVELMLDWGLVAWVFTPDSGESSNAVGPGNPFLGVRRVMQAGRSQFHFGIGIAAPASFVPEETDPDYARLDTAYQTAWAMHGMWNPWLWMPEHFSFAIPVGGDMVSEDNIFLGGETAFGVMIPVDNYRSATAEIVLQLAGEIGFGFDEVVETGIRVQGVALPVASGDTLQMGFGPFVRSDFGGGFLNARLMLNLDEVYGFFGGADIWGLHLGGGVNL